MADGGSAPGGDRPFEGIGTLSSMGNAVADEAGNFANTAKNQLGLNPQQKLPKNLSQTQQLQEIQKKQELEKKDQEKIAQLNRQIQEIIEQHKQEVASWDKKMLEDNEEEEQKRKQEELEEEQKKKEEEEKKLAAPVELPGSTPKGPPGVKKKATPLAVTQAVNKDIGRQAKG